MVAIRSAVAASRQAGRFVWLGSWSSEMVALGTYLAQVSFRDHSRVVNAWTLAADGVHASRSYVFTGSSGLEMKLQGASHAWQDCSCQASEWRPGGVSHSRDFKRVLCCNASLKPC